MIAQTILALLLASAAPAAADDVSGNECAARYQHIAGLMEMSSASKNKDRDPAYLEKTAQAIASHAGPACKEAGTAADRTPSAQQRADVDAAAGFDRSGEHDGVGTENVHLQQRLGRADLVEQPAGIGNAPGGH